MVVIHWTVEQLFRKYKNKYIHNSLSLTQAILVAVLDSLGPHLPVQEGGQVLCSFEKLQPFPSGGVFTETAPSFILQETIITCVK